MTLQSHSSGGQVSPQIASPGAHPVSPGAMSFQCVRPQVKQQQRRQGLTCRAAGHKQGPGSGDLSFPPSARGDAG